MSSQDIYLSIIIVAYRSRDEIGPCLTSLPRQLAGGIVETVVVDNSPGDGTGDLIRDEYPHVHYIPAAENLGFGRANNVGFGSTTGRIVLFLNPDTVCNAGALEHCARRLLTEERIGFISPRLMQPNGEMDAACRRSIPSIWDGFCRASGLAARFPHRRLFAGYNLTYLPEEGTYTVGAVNGAFMMSRRAVLNQVGTFDESFFMYGDDLDLCIRMAKAGYDIVYDGHVQILHLKGTSVSKEYEKMSAAIFDANRDVYLKHFNPTASGWTRLKYTAAFALWKRFARLRASLRQSRRVRPH